MLRALTFLLVVLCASPGAAAVTPQHPENMAAQINAPADEGIRFSCHPSRLKAIEAGMSAYLSTLKVAPSLIVKKTDRVNGIAVYTLNTPKGDTSTLDVNDRPELQIRDAIVFLPAKQGKKRKVVTVSKKEILLTLLQHGRLTEFKGDACDVQALKEHIGIRQNITAWAEDLNWVWPDGSPAKWNDKYWDHGTPKPGYPLHEALNDVFMNQDKYSIGCYTASKLLMVQGVLDYFRRIKKDRVQQERVKQRLLADHDPLRYIEPGRMWDFEKDFDPRELHRPGKLLKIEYRIAPKNFVPGDWVHFLNTDPASYRKTGYEGSNPIYLGRNKFADYFNDHHHSYTYQQKLDEVYQWRNGVFSRLRDAEKIKPLTPEDVEILSRPPSEGGLLTDMRVFPYFFGYEDLPELAARPASE
ncbi:hypothetical protein FGKAn22_19750 [Ferrigenium kumadai]|uniref:Uncharacterized protein n=1 Tax=Ferrigenium kumadai TaxID=1682490 RepID=A0AAN1T0R0_9PROT|nr:hypothetical protein FGKAn22_19750 [Ferrigenium kumadai]